MQADLRALLVLLLARLDSAEMKRGEKDRALEDRVSRLEAWRHRHMTDHESGAGP